MEALRTPHVRQVEGKLWELRVQAKGGIPRGLRNSGGPAGGSAACLREEVAKDAATSTRDSARMSEAGDNMTKLKELKDRLIEDPEFREEYMGLDDEYALIEALVRARATVELTQAELAQRLSTTQSAAGAQMAVCQSGRDD